MARSLRCPRCSTVVTVADGQSPVCPTCGFGGPDQPAPASPPPQPAASPGFSSPPPGPGPAPYGTPMGAPQGWPAQQRRHDGMCIAALVLGCLGWMSLPGIVMSILAIIFGVQGLNRIKRDPSLQGHGMAVAGIVLGSVFLAFWVLALMFIGAFLSAFSHAFR